MMQLLSHTTSEAWESDRSFGTPTRAALVLPAVLLVIAITAGVAVWLYARSPLLLTPFILLALMSMLVSLPNAAAALRSGNWMIRLSQHQLLLNLNHYRNPILADEFFSSVLLEAGDVDAIELETCQVAVPSPAGQTRSWSETCIVLHICEEHARRISSAISQHPSHQGEPRVGTRRYPSQVTCNKTRLQILWKSPDTACSPTPARMAEILAGALQISAGQTTVSTRYLESPEEAAVDMYRRGQRLDALRLLTHHTECSIAEAHRHLENAIQDISEQGEVS